MGMREITRPENQLVQQRFSLKLDSTSVEIGLTHRSRSLLPIIFRHGLGSTEEDYIDLVHHPGFSDQPFIIYDGPGCGETTCQDLSKASILFQLRMAEAVLQHFDINSFHLQRSFI